MLDPRILILDDALSAVDTYTEEEILTRLRGVMRQRTSIIVSHRMSTVRDADQIFVLDDGRIVERGTPRRAGRAATASTPTLHRKQLLRGGARQVDARCSGRRLAAADSHLNVHPRRRSPRQGLRRAADAAAAAVSAAVLAQVGVGAGGDHRQRRCCSWRSRT